VSRRALVATFALAAAALAGCRGGAPGEREYRGAPIVLVSIDTLRSDRLPVYGYAGVETPAIDALAQDAVVFDQAWSHVPLTLPSHVSMLSGQLPTVHGVRDNLGYRYDAAAHPSFAAALQQAGYATAGFVSSYVLRRETGVAAGFDTWDDDVSMRFEGTLGESQRPGSATVAAANRWLASAGDRPFFLFVHLYDPHTPYDAPEPFRSRHRNRYDADVAQADAALGALLDELRSRGLYDDAVVALVSDHGEGLGDHGEAEHGVLLYREALQVPLLLKLPGGDRAGSRVAEPAQLVDLFPTLLGLAGVDAAAAAKAPLPGRSLLAAAGGEPRDVYAETYYPRLHYGWSELTSLVRGRFHYIHGPDPELYDLTADPQERRTVLRQERRTYADMRDALAELTAELVAPGAVDAETRQRMAALGYAGGSVAVAPGEPLPDPKKSLPVLGQLGRARELVAADRPAEAVPLLQALLASSPRLEEGWEQLAGALLEVGRFDESLAAWQKALELSGGASHVAVSAGSVLLLLGRPDEARAHAELGLAGSPAGARDLLARIALEADDLAAAEREARLAVEAGGERLAPLLTLAQVQTQSGRLDEALATVQEAERLLRAEGGDQTFPGLRFVRGDVLARLGRAEEAERDLIAEIRAAPFDPRAYTALAALYVAAGEPAGAVATLRALVERNRESPAAWAEAVKALRVLGDPEGASRLLRQARTVHPDNPQLAALEG
jgi:arylsulfatase A-like enzyme/Flp pilus assembly protein TadD